MNIAEINRIEVVKEVTKTFYRYEKALISNDIAVLDELFWDDERTIRFGASENLYGIQQIREFRIKRSSYGLVRTLNHIVITTFGEDFAVCSTEFTRLDTKKTGRQQQTWVRMPQGWRIVAAQISLI